MKRTHIALAGIVAAVLLISSGCAVVSEPSREVVVVESDGHGPPPWAPAHGWRRKHERYHYYPAIEVYYYPSVRRYYWLEGGDWRIGTRLPRHYVLKEHRRVVLDLDYEPHKHHGRIKHMYPPGQYKKYKKKAGFKW